MIPGWGRCPGGGPGNPLQCSCLEIPWTEEPGGPQRVGQDWVTELSGQRASVWNASSPQGSRATPSPAVSPPSCRWACCTCLTEPMWVKTRSYKCRSDFTWTSAPVLWPPWLRRGPGWPCLISQTSWGLRPARWDQGHGTGNPPWVESHTFSATDDLELLDWICFLRKHVLVLFQESSSFVTV